MYQDFGAREIDNTRQARFRLFIPDNSLDSGQYGPGKLPGITTVTVMGDFQAHFGSTNWTPDPAFEMEKSAYTDPEDGKTKGWLYEMTTGPLNEGFYQYKFFITYLSGATRVVVDPCTRYGGSGDQNSAFVIGGPKMTTLPLKNPLPLNQQVLYELMIDDFSATIRGNQAPLTVVKGKLDYLQTLGVTGLQIMPWTQWPGDAYNWGYEPHSFFSVAYRYTMNPANPAEKLYLLKQLISDYHKRGMSVFMDGVFDHVTGAGVQMGFGYHWIWENPDDSPYTGNFAGAGYGIDLDYHNDCVEDFIFDVCRYWMDVFAIDGIRFDYTMGFYDPVNEGSRGLPDLVQRLRQWLAPQGKADFPLIIEHAWDYTSIDEVNKTGVTACWLDPFRSQARSFLSNRQAQTGIMRMLDAARDFGPGRAPVTYIENHDHETLMINAGGRDQWWRTQPYAIALLTAPGAPLIHNGQEFGEIYPMPEPFQEDPSAPPESQDPARKRVVPRPLLWSQLKDGPGQALLALYHKLVALRRSHPGLTSPNFYPGFWDESRSQLDGDGFGIDVDRQLVVYHRWGNAADGRLEKFTIVLNFSDSTQTVTLSFPEDGGWVDLLSGWTPPVINHHLRLNIGSNWGQIFYKKY